MDSKNQEYKTECVYFSILTPPLTRTVLYAIVIIYTNIRQFFTIAKIRKITFLNIVKFVHLPDTFAMLTDQTDYFFFTHLQHAS